MTASSYKDFRDLWGCQASRVCSFEPSPVPPGVPDTGGRKLTPMLEQYLAAKREVPEAVLLFRMGDFYELFFEDAVVAAKVLGVTLTAREKNDRPIPMAGVPHHASEAYITRLLREGYDVAICDQMEDPAAAVGIVKRAVTRVITPGTEVDPANMETEAPQLLAVCLSQEETNSERGCALALLDVSAGRLMTTTTPTDDLLDALLRLGVREILLEDAYLGSAQGLVRAKVCVRVLRRRVRLSDAEAILSARLGPPDVRQIEGQALSPTHEIALAEAIMYAERMQRRPLTHLGRPQSAESPGRLRVDLATRNNLELFHRSSDGAKDGSLFAHLDRTQTAMGRRALKGWMLNPLSTREAIESRQEEVARLMSLPSTRQTMRQSLGRIRDLERLCGRLSVGRATPRCMVAIGSSLRAAQELAHALTQDARKGSLSELWRKIPLLTELGVRLSEALVELPPNDISAGGLFRKGFDARLDTLIGLSTEGHQFLLALEDRERKRSQIPSLKVRYNRVVGYYIEVTRANLQQIPSDYERRQTLVNAERFVTPELKRFEVRVLGADADRSEREQELYAELVREVTANLTDLRSLSTLIGETDAFLSLADVADEGDYVRPILSARQVLFLDGARHPVVERLIPQGERYVPNDLCIDAKKRQLLVVTGPNMAGKSTVMRQAALCILLAHMGSFVPARRAEIGLCDRLFVRVGASDNLGRGQSTFMVEMLETAAILRDATAKSFVVLDEIGRGTSTFDGVAIAWSVAEYIHNKIGCRALFATHYHELSALAGSLTRVHNASMSILEQDGKLIFLRQLVDGATSRSYGIEVAKLALLPAGVVARARALLQTFEKKDASLRLRHTPRQLSLLTAAARPLNKVRSRRPLYLPPLRKAALQHDAKNYQREEPLIRQLLNCDTDKMTPLEALNKLSALRDEARKTAEDSRTKNSAVLHSL